MSLVLETVSIAHKNGPPLFAPLTLTVETGEIVVIMGASGVGKSTLLDAIGGHLHAHFTMKGRIWLDGVAIHALAPEHRRVGVLFQDAVLFPHLSVADNLAFGLSETVTGRVARRDAVAAALDQAGLAGLGERDPATLSGGQRARVALMRTLLAEPQAVLLDEPFGSLDPSLRQEMRAFTFEHMRARNIPALLVSHDGDDARAAGGRVMALSARGLDPDVARPAPA